MYLFSLIVLELLAFSSFSHTPVLHRLYGHLFFSFSLLVRLFSLHFMTQLVRLLVIDLVTRLHFALLLSPFSSDLYLNLLSLDPGFLLSKVLEFCQQSQFVTWPLDFSQFVLPFYALRLQGTRLSNGLVLSLSATKRWRWTITVCLLTKYLTGQVLVDLALDNYWMCIYNWLTLEVSLLDGCHRWLTKKKHTQK